MGAVELLRELADDLGARGVREALELEQMFDERLAGAGPLERGADQDRPLDRRLDRYQIA